MNNWKRNDAYERFRKYIHNESYRRSHHIRCNVKMYDTQNNRDLVVWMVHISQMARCFANNHDQLVWNAKELYHLKDCDLYQYSNGEIFYLSFDLVSNYTRLYMYLKSINNLIQM